MPMHLFCLIFILFATAQALHLQIPYFTDRRSNPPSEHAYNKLPQDSWSILEMDESVRANLCKRQVSYCAQSCPDPVANFCNATSMAFTCQCASSVSLPPPQLWPVAIEECNGKHFACVRNCLSRGERGQCVTACERWWGCGAASGPVTGLWVESVETSPRYFLEQTSSGPWEKQGREDPRSTNSAAGRGMSGVVVGVFMVILAMLLV
ncbi:uncharacterized protein VTP21DRAFT_1139 [Calcarisporiella thermophila]|uniref:uncharacterized protein n=1 Tax=Calcarisporiella thermophila TaxID=911321 RepID=UPI003743DCEF